MFIDLQKTVSNFSDFSDVKIGHFEVTSSLFFKTRLRALIILISHANKTHFHMKGCALGFVLKLRVLGTRKWPIGLTVSYHSDNNSYS